MRTLIAVTLYLIGTFVYAIWIVTNEDTSKEIKRKFDDNPDTAMLPESVLKVCMFIAVLMVSLLWTVFVIKAPFDALKDRLK